ncbi:MAG TPA: hypothetical protein PK275_01070 [Chitinophagaceae bacterium]|nr:hypothetical protein [Chitinophagaceae bacterium]
MSVVVITLSCFPCNDAACESVKYQTELTTANHNSCPAESHHADACTPFCTCSCCATAFCENVNLFPAYTTAFQTTNKHAYASDNVLDISLPVWQPPQLG